MHAMGVSQDRGLQYLCLLDFPCALLGPTPVLLPGKSNGQRSLVGYSPWGRKGSDTTEQLHFHFTFTLPRKLHVLIKQNKIKTFSPEYFSLVSSVLFILENNLVMIAP